MIRTRFGKTLFDIWDESMYPTENVTEFRPAKYDSELYKKQKDSENMFWAAKRLAGYNNAILSLRSYFSNFHSYMPCA